jgi:myo-inositol-1(or 4)-monophosphatase
MTNEEFTASRGDGAQLNARRLRTGNATEITPGSLVGLESPLEINEAYLQFQTRLLRLGAGLRISGCPALDIVNTAAGRLVGGWATQQPRASIAAASLILHEAGGLLGNENANPKWNSGDELIYGNLKTFKQLSKIRKNQP